MKPARNQTSVTKTLFVSTFAMLLLVAGCSSTDMPTSGALSEFLTDFTREVFAAWLL